MSATNGKQDDNRRIYVLDGGFSSQISRHVGTTSDGDPLWTSRFLQTNPEDVVKTHLDFLRAGSDIISTNTYQASIGAFVKHLQVSPEEGLTLIKRAVELAKEARAKYIEECQSTVRNILIAGSVGPFGAALNDGSEYSGSYIDKTTEETIQNWHKPRIEALIESGVDLLAFETIPGGKEGLVLMNMLKEYPSTKAWISFSCKDGTSLPNGERFQDVAKKCWKANSEQLLAIGMNCCSPKIVSHLIATLDKDTKIPIVTYPNSGEKYDPSCGWKDDHCKPLHTFVSEWLDLNVNFIGGCCRTFCEDIAAIRKEVDTWLAQK